MRFTIKHANGQSIDFETNKKIENVLHDAYSGVGKDSAFVKLQLDEKNNEKYIVLGAEYIKNSVIIPASLRF